MKKKLAHKFSTVYKMVCHADNLYASWYKFSLCSSTLYSIQMIHLVGLKKILEMLKWKQLYHYYIDSGFANFNNFILHQDKCGFLHDIPFLLFHY